MRVHQRSRLSPRPAFTLVELMVVIVIVGVLAALTILILPKLQDSQRVAKGADVVQGQLFLAKQMALRDQLPRGVRLIPDPGNNLVHSLQLIEQPLPYATGQVTAVTAVPATAPTTWVVTFTASADFSNGTVQALDYLDLTAGGASDPYTTISPHALHLITAVAPGTATSAPTVTVKVEGQMPSVVTPCNYRIIRSPRPAVGINPVALPSDVVVDCPLASVHPALGTSLGLPTSGNQDILFDPSGKVLGTAGVNGKVVLWVYDPTGGTPEQTLVAVYTRPGNIVAQPVNLTGADPFAFVKDGATSGM